MINCLKKRILGRFVNATIVPFVKHIVKMAELDDTKQLLFSEIDSNNQKLVEPE
jgi:hypothetical protein